MAQAISKLITFEEFIEWYPENPTKRYELHDGVITEMSQPVGKHEEVIGFLSRKITIEYDRLNLPYFIPKTALLKPSKKNSGFLPDIVLLNNSNLKNEDLWEKASTVTLSGSIPLVIEVVSQCVARVPRVEATDEPVRVSTNWEDDYYTRLGNYESMGIPEYWIADYAALGARKFIGNPKQPTLSICNLLDSEYQISLFRGDDMIKSLVFPELKLTVNEIFRVSE
jgi:Uma2 family endonuclease